MKRHRLWPILPPVIAVALITGFLSITTWLSGGGAQCTFLKYTGFYCPGCGGTRCAGNLASGNLAAAFGHNALLASGAVAFSTICLLLIVRVTLLGKSAPSIYNIHAKWLWAGVGLLVLFAVLRNIPAWPFSLLAP